MNVKLLTATAVLTTAIAAPAMAQDPALGGTNRQDAAGQARVYHRESGLLAGRDSCGVVGGAIGTAGAIATAPFRNDSYAYDDGYYGRRYYGGYNNGFVCQPGTTFLGEDGPTSYLSVNSAHEIRRQPNGCLLFGFWLPNTTLSCSA